MPHDPAEAAPEPAVAGNSRQRRSADRLRRHQEKIVRERLANCKLRAVLQRAMRIQRWRRMQSVWTAWMQQCTMQVATWAAITAAADTRRQASSGHSRRSRRPHEWRPRSRWSHRWGACGAGGAGRAAGAARGAASRRLRGAAQAEGGGGRYSGGRRPRGHRHRRLGAGGGGTAGGDYGRMADGGVRARAHSAAADGGGGGRSQVAGDAGYEQPDGLHHGGDSLQGLSFNVNMEILG